ncbi:hypothetical protein BC826DRAFT_281717 [Russula brevipes]|nr:hypothetical protein BC826DRAFT_281717 [Russula brevipes]
MRTHCPLLRLPFSATLILFLRCLISDLFDVVTPINIDRFASLLAGHPNRPFVDTVICGLREGFWPLAHRQAVRRLVACVLQGTAGGTSAVLDLGDERDVADYDVISLAEDYVGRDNRKGQKRAMRLDESGPRMEIKVVKIMPGKDGAVIYHEFEDKSGGRGSKGVARCQGEAEKVVPRGAGAERKT